MPHGVALLHAEERHPAGAIVLVGTVVEIELAVSAARVEPVALIAFARRHERGDDVHVLDVGRPAVAETVSVVAPLFA